MTGCLCAPALSDNMSCPANQLSHMINSVAVGNSRVTLCLCPLLSQHHWGLEHLFPNTTTVRSGTLYLLTSFPTPTSWRILKDTFSTSSETLGLFFFLSPYFLISLTFFIFHLRPLASCSWLEPRREGKDWSFNLRSKDTAVSKGLSFIRELKWITKRAEACVCIG